MVRCRIAMPEVVSSNGSGQNEFTKVMGSDGKLKILTFVLFVLCSVMVSDCII